MQSFREKCLIRSQAGLIYPSGALIEMGFWDYFLRSNARHFKTKSFFHFFLNTYICRNSRNWATQDIILHLAHRIQRIILRFRFPKQNGFYYNRLPLTQIQRLYTQARMEANQIEIHYRTELPNPTSVFREFTPLAQAIQNHPQRVTTNPELVNYFNLKRY